MSDTFTFGVVDEVVADTYMETPQVFNGGYSDTFDFGGFPSGQEFNSGYSSPDYTGGSTSAPLPVATGDTNFFGGLTGVLNSGLATANSLLKAWGTVQGIQSTAENQQFQRELARADIGLRQTQLTSATEIAKTKAQTEASLEKLRAESAVALASNQAAAARGGGIIAMPSGVSMKAVAGVTALGLVLVWAFKGKKGKK